MRIKVLVIKHDLRSANELRVMLETKKDFMSAAVLRMVRREWTEF